jgi:hypothetical protein
MLSVLTFPSLSGQQYETGLFSTYRDVRTCLAFGCMLSSNCSDSSMERGGVSRLDAFWIPSSNCFDSLIDRYPVSSFLSSTFI